MVFDQPTPGWFIAGGSAINGSSKKTRPPSAAGIARGE
jgi:hypothetical protein